jgi:metal-responsive CopG/Arc/MetJ family transcriptional regulator
MPHNKIYDSYIVNYFIDVLYKDAYAVSMATTNRNLPLAVDQQLLAEIDRVADATKQTRSAVMRRAIREGLPAVEAGTSTDVVSLDSELSKDVDQISKEGNVSRAKVIIESIRTGAQAFYNRIMREQIMQSQQYSPRQAEILLQGMEQSNLADEPMNREVRTAFRQRGAAMTRFWDLLRHVPEAWRRHQLVEKLSTIRASPGGGGGGTVWGCGLSTEEVEWQVKMAEKYGVGAKIPDKEITAREAARAREDRKHRDTVGDEVIKLYPPDWQP